MNLYIKIKFSPPKQMYIAAEFYFSICDPNENRIKFGVCIPQFRGVFFAE